MRERAQLEAESALPDPMERVLRSQGHLRRHFVPADLQERVLGAWKLERRQEPVVLSRLSSSATGGRLTAMAACAALMFAAVLLARMDGNDQQPTPSASSVLSNSLRVIPRTSQNVVRLASLPIRTEARRLTDAPRRVLSSLDLLSRSPSIP